uniref:Coagulation factor X n=1 Tax=Aceria tosichella TaxID=561515 RepID=A0A6G1SM59_9ACAR
MVLVMKDDKFKLFILAKLFILIIIGKNALCYINNNHDNRNELINGFNGIAPNGKYFNAIRTKQRSKDIVLNFIDAYDESVCGKSKMRDWQMDEQAFNCSYSSRRATPGRYSRMTAGGMRANSSSDRIVDGDPAHEGEFPSMVQVLPTIPQRPYGFCGGTLIHSNLVITAAHCVESATEVTIRLGSLLADNSDGIEISADKWLYTGNFSNDYTPDLALVRLSEDVDYVVGRIEPACLRIKSRHHDNAICAAAGFGGDYGHRLQTIALKRNCDHEHYLDQYSTCYARPSPNEPGGLCRGDSGSGLYCFAPKRGCGEQRSYVVGAAVAVPNKFSHCLPGKKYYQYFVDFQKNSDMIQQMVASLAWQPSGEW